MFYYETKNQVKDLAKEFKSAFTHRSDLKLFIQKKHELRYLGIFASMTKDSIWVGAGRIKKDHQFKVNEEVLDFLVGSNMLSQLLDHASLIQLFGRLEKGKVVDIVGFNMASIIDPQDVE